MSTPTIPTATHPQSSMSCDELPFETGNPETQTYSGVVSLSRASQPNSSMVLVSHVPGLMSCADFCTFVTPFIDRITHLRPLRVPTERNRYVVILNFKTTSDVALFKHAFEGKQFLHGLVQDVCHVTSVLDVKFDDATGQLPTFPYSKLFPADAQMATSCPVCLEALSSQPSLVTTFCNHTLHTSCLSKCSENRCPVCRYSHELVPEASTCMKCSESEDLWMCVICAFVGCGVYKNKHANDHFKQTHHPFAINLEDSIFWSGERLRKGTVWDYSSERFVNRLLSSDDGKVVEVSQEPGAAAASSNSADACCNSSLLLDDEDEVNDRGLQAAMYASRMDAVVADYRRRMEVLEREFRSERQRLHDKVEKLTANVTKLTKERKTMHKKVSDGEKEVKKIQERNDFLKTLSENLLKDSKVWNEQVTKLKDQLSESESSKASLEEQLRDVMLHLEAQAKIETSADSCRTSGSSDASELRGGDVVVRVGPSPRERLHRKTNRR